MSLEAWIVGPGRMGSAIEDEWTARGHSVDARIDRGDSWPAAADCDVAFEFTDPEAASENVGRLLERGIPTVCGTTGWDLGPMRRQADDRGVPLLVAPNFSAGVAALRAGLRAAAERLAGSGGCDPAVVERHHRGKLDAPSGTAAMLADEMDALLDVEPDVASLRQGEQPGEHRVIFEGPDEELELVHRARSRHPFVAGAVDAAEWLAVERPPGSVSFDTFLQAGRTSDE